MLSPCALRWGLVALAGNAAFQFTTPFHVAAQISYQKAPKAPKPVETPLNHDIKALKDSPLGATPAPWLKLLSEHVPTPFRSSSPLSIYRPDSSAPTLDAANFLLIMETARQHANVDLLCYLGPSEGRWRSLRWTVEILLAECEEGRSRSKNPSIPLQEPDLINLAETTNNAIQPELQEEILALNAMLYCGESSTLGDRAFSQLWQSLGSLVLQAECQRDDQEAYKAIMSHVLNAIGQMHHKGFFPETIYNYDPAKDSSAVQRPPALWLLSSRIMSQLSDVVWNRQYLDALAKAEEEGRKLPVPLIQPSFQSIGTEVWLELILWACVEGGWIFESAWIISEMERIGNETSKPWSVINWPQLCKLRPPTLGWAAVHKLQIDRSRTDQYTGISIGDGDVSNVDMGTRTISEEVILATVDGLVNTAGLSSMATPKSTAEIKDFIVLCKGLLERGGAHFDPEFMNAILLRLIGTAGIDLRDSPHELEDLIQLSPILDNAHIPNETVLSAIDQSPIDPSASVLGYLYRCLELFAANDDVAGVTRTLGSISNVLDANRSIYIREFADELRMRSRESKDLETHRASIKKQVPLLHPQVPVHVLDSLIKFVNENQPPGLGHFLFHDNSIDGGFVQSSAFAEPSLQPRLLEYAIANKNEAVLTRVLEQLQPPFPLPILRALVEYYISTHRWSAVQEIFTHMSASTDNTAWTANQVMAIAAYIIQRSNSRNRENRDRAQTAGILLSDVLKGVYDPPRDPSRAIHINRTQLANQIKRILRSVPKRQFDFLAFDEWTEKGRLAKTIPISSGAFCVFLQAVVEKFGCHAGREMWERWCTLPEERYSRLEDDESVPLADGVEDKPVVSRRYLVTAVVRPLLRNLEPEGDLELQQLKWLDGSGEGDGRYRKAFKGLPKEDKALLRWAVAVSRISDGRAMGDQI